MEKKFKTFIGIAVVAILLQGIVTFIWLNNRPKTAYIDTEIVYNGFDLKKELESELKSTEKARQTLLDSMRLQLEMLALQLQQEEKKSDQVLAGKFNQMRESYFAKQKEFENANIAMADQYTSEVWTQLNTYIKEYGEQEGYEYIFGASGNGSLMYADDAVNVTEDVNVFVNNRYQGK